MADPVPAVRVAALRALGASRRREVIGSLTAALERGAADEQVAAAEALGSIPAEEVVPILRRVFDRTRLMRKERGPVQLAAARALGRLPGQAARQALAALADDGDQAVARIARDALTASA